jgi:hypothetical protein
MSYQPKGIITMITLNAQDKNKLEAALARAEAADLKLTVLYQSTPVLTTWSIVITAATRFTSGWKATELLTSAIAPPTSSAA